MPTISSRTKHFTESVIRRMTRIAQSHSAINLSQGFPDFDPPRELTERLALVAPQGPHQYSLTMGAKNFRQALCEKQLNFSGQWFDPDTQVCVTCGSTEAMMAALMSTTEKGDKVIVFSPFYENYGADTILCSAKPIYVELQGKDFTFDKQELRSAFIQGVKALILCNPSNPTGKVFTFEELSYIAQLAQEFDTWVITDEVYEHIVYPPYKHLYFSTFPGMAERTLVCSSLSKTYSITGWRLGYVLGPETVMETVKKIHDFLTVGASAPLQEAAIAGLEMNEAYYKKLGLEYREKRELFLSYLDRAGLTYTKPQGAYYVMVDISEFSKTNDTRFCEWLAKEVGVAAVPGSSFFKEKTYHLIRFHFAKREETLHAAGKRLLLLKQIWVERGY